MSHFNNSKIASKYVVHLHYKDGTSKVKGIAAYAEITGMGLRQARYVIENDGGLAHSDCETFRRLVVDDRELEMVKAALDPYFNLYVMELENVLPYGMMVGPAPWDNPYLARP